MTVQQLIQKLSQFDPDLQVVCRGINTAGEPVDHCRIALMEERKRKYGRYYEYGQGAEAKRVVMLD
jgi:hypothetical protein